MAAGKLHPAQYYLEYPDKQIVAYPLPNVPHTWSTLMFLLEKPVDMRRQTEVMRRIQTTPQYAERYIASAIKNLFVFDFVHIVDYLFRIPTPMEVVCDNLTNREWRNIKSKHDFKEFDHEVCGFLLQAIQRRLQEHRHQCFITEKDDIIKDVKKMITTRSALAFVLSIFSSHCANRLKDLWYEVLGFIADENVSPPARFESCEFTLLLIILFFYSGQTIFPGYPQEFIHLFGIQRPHRDIYVVKAMQKVLVQSPAPPPLDGELPVEHLVVPSSKAEQTAEYIQEFGLLGGMFEEEHPPPPKKRRLQPHPVNERALVDLPALRLGDLGEPLPKPKTTALVSFHELRASFRADPGPLLPPAPAHVARAVQQMPVDVVVAEPVQPPPDPESPLFRSREPSPDPFANFAAPAFDQEAWVMQVDPSERGAWPQDA